MPARVKGRVDLGHYRLVHLEGHGLEPGVPHAAERRDLVPHPALEPVPPESRGLRFELRA